jgi:ABC-type proline/glycine betaine transport system permease subunit
MTKLRKPFRIALVILVAYLVFATLIGIVELACGNGFIFGFFLYAPFVLAGALLMVLLSFGFGYGIVKLMIWATED